MPRALPLLAVMPVLLWTTPATAAPRPLRNAADILAAVKAGGTVRAVFHYKDMRLVNATGHEEQPPDAIGGMALDPFEYFAAGSIGNPIGYLAASHVHLIRHPRHGYVLNYVRVTIEDTGAVRILAQYLEPETHKVLMDETFHTEIADGVNKGAARFFLVE